MVRCVTSTWVNPRCASRYAVTVLVVSLVTLCITLPLAAVVITVLIVSSVAFGVLLILIAVAITVLTVSLVTIGISNLDREFKCNPQFC